VIGRACLYAAACPSNCLQCTVNSAGGAAECDTDKCRSGYGLKESDKTCVSKCPLPRVSYLLLSHHTVVWLGHLVYCVFGCLSFCNFLFVRLRISQRRRMGREIFASVLAYYPDRSSPVLVNVSSREVTGAAALRRE